MQTKLLGLNASQDSLKSSDDSIDDAATISTNKLEQSAQEKQEIADKEKVEHVENKDIGGLSSSMEFYKLIKEKAKVKDTEEAKKQYNLHKKITRNLQPLVMIIYIFIVPALESPNWCNNYYGEKSQVQRTDLWLDCSSLGYPYSQLPTMGPFFTAFADILCVCFFGFVRWYKTKWREQTKYDRRRNIIMLCIFTISLVDLTLAIIQLRQPYISAFLRPFLLASCMASIRHNASTLWKDIKDSSVILLSIFLFVLVYSAIGYFVFEFTIEGYLYFNNLAMSYYSMLILLTTANFPDVMLPAYNASFFWSIYFVSFLILGLYALLNLLLAQVFNGFRNRLVEEGVHYLKKMEKHLEKFFKRFDGKMKDYLTADELKHFINVLLDMKIDEKERDQAIYDELIRLMAPEDLERVSKERIFDFFMIEDGYIEFKKLMRMYAKNQSQLERQLSTLKSSYDGLKSGLQTGLTYVGVQNEQTPTAEDNFLLEPEFHRSNVRRINTSDFSLESSTYKISRSDSLMEMNREEKAKYSECQMRWLNYLTNAYYNGAMDLMNLGLTILILVFNVHIDVGNLKSGPVVILCIIIQFVFFFDLIANFAVIGWRKLWESRKLMYFEILLQLDFLIQASLQGYEKRNYSGRETEFLDLAIVFILRNARLIYYLDVVRDAKFVEETVKYLSKPIMTKFFFVYLIYYEYAYMGMVFLGGEITYKVYQDKLAGDFPAFYWLMNFNDFGASIIVLFQQMVVNNWWVVVNLQTEAIGYEVPIRIWFVSFWVITVLILMNIVIAIVLEIYGSVSAEVDKKFNKQISQQQIYKMLKDDDIETMKAKLRQASIAMDRLKNEVKLREQLSSKRTSVFAPGINADFDPLEHAMAYNEDQNVRLIHYNDLVHNSQDIRQKQF